MIPPDEGLESRDPAVLDAHDGLVVHAELAPFDRAAQVVLELQQPAGARVHRGVEHLVARLPQGLGAVHGGVGVAQELIGSDVVTRLVESQSDARPHGHLATVEVERLRERIQHTLRRCFYLMDGGHILEQDPELVAAEAGDGVTGTQAAAQPVADGLQDGIARRVAQPVVDELEAVQVEEQHRGAAT